MVVPKSARLFCRMTNPFHIVCVLIFLFVFVSIMFVSVAAGAAAGVAAGFNAPIAGVFFALEIAQGRFNS